MSWDALVPSMSRCPSIVQDATSPPHPSQSMSLSLPNVLCPSPMSPVPPHCPLSPQTKLNEDFTVKAEGTGKGTMTVVTVYNAKVPEKDNKCDNFDLRVDVEDVKMGESPSVPHVSSSCSHHVPLGASHVSSMSHVPPRPLPCLSCQPYFHVPLLSLSTYPCPSRPPCPLQVPLAPFTPSFPPVPH